jgi:hypothetical protein
MSPTAIQSEDTVASLRERHLKTIVAVLGAAVRRGLYVDEDDFHHVTTSCGTRSRWPTPRAGAL